MNRTQQNVGVRLHHETIASGHLSRDQRSVRDSRVVRRHHVTAQMVIEHRTASDSVDGITFFAAAAPGFAIAALVNAAWVGWRSPISGVADVERHSCGSAALSSFGERRSWPPDWIPGDHQCRMGYTARAA